MSYRIEEIREVHFYRQGSETDPSMLITEIYRPLENLVKYNREHKPDKYSPAFRGEGDKEIYRNALIGVKEETDFTANIVFNDGKKTEFKVKPRTNFDEDTPKFPNIVYLESEVGDHLIFREARQYYEDPFVQRAIRQVFKNHYLDIPIDQVVQEDRSKLIRRAVSVPEPQLIASLENLCRSKGLIRLTPKIRTVEVSKEGLWYIRSFLPSVRDTHLNDASFLNFIGTFNGLGLIDRLDGRVSHYCVNNRGVVVNIDPDFIMYTDNFSMIDDYDWQNFKNARTEGLDISHHFSRGVNKERRKVIESVRETLEGKVILDYVPADLTQDRIMRELGVDNLTIKGVGD